MDELEFKNIDRCKDDLKTDQVFFFIFIYTFQMIPFDTGHVCKEFKARGKTRT